MTDTALQDATEEIGRMMSLCSRPDQSLVVSCSWMEARYNELTAEIVRQKKAREEIDRLSEASLGFKTAKDATRRDKVWYGACNYAFTLVKQYLPMMPKYHTKRSRPITHELM